MTESDATRDYLLYCVEASSLYFRGRCAEQARTEAEQARIGAKQERDRAEQARLAAIPKL